MAKIDYDTMADLMRDMCFMMEWLWIQMSCFQVQEAHRLGKPLRFLCEECGEWSETMSGDELFDVPTPYTCPSCQEYEDDD